MDIENRKDIYLHNTNQGECVVVCLPGGRIDRLTERIKNILGPDQGWLILVYVGTNNADREGTTRIV